MIPFIAFKSDALTDFERVFTFLSENTPNIADPLVLFDVILSVKSYCIIYCLFVINDYEN